MGKGIPKLTLLKDAITAASADVQILITKI
jgi:hypothetical protein